MQHNFLISLKYRSREEKESIELGQNVVMLPQNMLGMTIQHPRSLQQSADIISPQDQQVIVKYAALTN